MATAVGAGLAAGSEAKPSAVFGTRGVDLGGYMYDGAQLMDAVVGSSWSGCSERRRGGSSYGSSGRRQQTGGRSEGEGRKAGKGRGERGRKLQDRGCRCSCRCVAGGGEVGMQWARGAATVGALALSGAAFAALGFRSPGPAARVAMVGEWTELKEAELKEATMGAELKEGEQEAKEGEKMAMEVDATAEGKPGEEASSGSGGAKAATAEVVVEECKEGDRKSVV